MALGFKIADGYVDVHAKYDKNELQRAAALAANDFGDGFDKESRRNRKVRVSAQVEDSVNRDRNVFHRIGARMSRSIREGMLRDVATAGPAFGQRFIEAITFGQSDISKIKTAGKISRLFAGLGTALGAALATALVFQAGNAITALLPVALGGALLAIPIADLIFRNVTLEKGKLTFLKNQIGNALKNLVRGAQDLADALGRAFSPAMLAGLESAARLLEAIRQPMIAAVRAISPGALAMWNGLLRAVVAFGVAMKPALAGINAGLKQWGVELPKIGKAIGEAFASILKNPALVRTAVQGLSNLIQGIAKVAAGLVVFLTYALAAWRNLWRVVGYGWSTLSKILGIGQAWARVTQAFGPLKTAILGVWDAFKKFATATNGQQATQRLAELVRRIKALWGPLKTFLGEVWKMAWDKIKQFWNEKIKPWVTGTLEPWLKKKLKEVGKAGFKALVDGAVAEAKKLPGKAVQAIKDLWSKLKAKFEEAKDKAKQKIKDLVDGVVDKIKALPGKAQSAVSNLWSKMSSKFKDAVTKAKNAAKDLVTGFITKIKELPGKAATIVGQAKSKIVAKFSGAIGWLKSAGKDIARGLADGISSGLSWVTDAAKRLATAAKNAAKSALGISSPSKVFMEEVGKPSAEGFALGLEKNLPKEMPGMRTRVPQLVGAGAAGGNTVSNTWNPSLNVNISEGLNPINAAARRALIRELFLELEQYRKDYVR